MPHQLFDVADAHAGIKQHGLLRPQDKVGDDFFLLMRFVDGEHAGTYSINFKPLVWNGDSFQRAIRRSWQVTAPFRFLCGNGNHKQKCKEQFSREGHCALSGSGLAGLKISQAKHCRAVCKTCAGGWAAQGRIRPGDGRDVLNRAVAEPLLAHELQGVAKAFIVLVAERNEAEGIGGGGSIFLPAWQEFHQGADRAGRGVQPGFSNSHAVDRTLKFRQSPGKREFVEHRRNHAATEIKANGVIIWDTYARSACSAESLRKMWHGEMMPLACSHREDY